MAGPFMDIDTPYNTNYTPRFHNYTLLNQLGEGSEGKVILVRKNDSSHRQVMKIRMRDRGRKALPAEMIIQWDVLQHHLNDKRGANIVKVHDFWWEKPQVSILMTEWCDEGDLRGFINRNISNKKSKYRLPNYLVAHVMAHLLNGMIYLHTGREFDFRKRIWRERPQNWNGGVVHRDIKPENIFIRGAHRTNDEFCLPEFVIGDLGWACPMSEESQMRLEFRTDLSDDVTVEPFQPEKLGDAFYNPPEAVGLFGRKKAKLSPQTDVYSLGLTFHELMTGLNAVETGGIVEVSSRYDPALVSTVKAMVDPCPNKRIRTGQLRGLMVQILKIRDYYAPIEKPLPGWTFDRWRLNGDIGLKIPPGTSAGVTGMVMENAARRRARGWVDDSGLESMSSGLGLAIRVIGGSRKRYHKLSQEYLTPISTLDSLRLSIPKTSIFRATMLESLGAVQPPSTRKSQSDGLRKHRRRHSSPTGGHLLMAAKPCPKCVLVKTDRSKAGKPRKTSWDFGCAGLEEDELVCICGAFMQPEPPGIHNSAVHENLKMGPLMFGIDGILHP